MNQFKLFAYFSLLFLLACSTLKAGPAKSVGFIKHSKNLIEDRERAPFHGIWYSDKKLASSIYKNYSAVYVKEIDTSYIFRNINRLNGDDQFKLQRMEETKEVAEYFRARLQILLEDNVHKNFKVLSKPKTDNSTLVIEIAFAELNPTNPAINSVGFLAGLFVPGGGIIKIAGKGSIAIEGRVIDSLSQKSLLEFKDKESDTSSPFSVKDFQEYAHVRKAIDDWASQIAELLATPGKHTVEDSLPFEVI